MHENKLHIEITNYIACPCSPVVWLLGHHVQ